MGRLLVKKLHPDAKLPTVAYPGEDLGYDIYALEDTFLEPNKQVIVKTGIAAVYIGDPLPLSPAVRLGGKWVAPEAPKYGLEVDDRSGMAAKNGIHTLAGKIDAGYRNEIGVVMILLGPPQHRSSKILVMMAKQDRFAGISADAVSEILRTEIASDIWNARLRHGSYCGAEEFGYQIKAGDKIAQLLPREILTSTIDEVEELPEGGARGMNGYGSTGR